MANSIHIARQVLCYELCFYYFWSVRFDDVVSYRKRRARESLVLLVSRFPFIAMIPSPFESLVEREEAMS